MPTDRKRLDEGTDMAHQVADGELLALETTAFGDRWHGVTPLIVPEQALRGGQVRRL